MPVRNRGEQVRPALRELVNQVAEARLAIVVAPAGCGKTTLLSCWRREIAAAGVDCPWLQVSPLHDDPVLFLEDLFEAIPREAGPPPGAQLMLEIPHVDREETHAIARRVRQALRGRPRPLHVFLDDTHRLSRDGPTERLLDLLIREGPAELRFVIASRGARPRAAARLIAAGEALEVSAEDLSLRSDQVAAVLRAGGIDPAKLTPMLLAETRGWAAGVQLAAGALARIDETQHDAFIQALAGQPDLFDYVAGELIAGESPESLHLLERAAVLGPVTESMLLAAPSDHIAAGTLTGALDRGLLVREGNRLGLPPLWGEYVLGDLRRRSTRDAWRSLHARGAEQLAHTDPERALKLCSEGHAWDLLSQVLDEHGRGWLDRGRYHFVEEWLERLDEAGFPLTPKQLHLGALTAARRDPAGAIASLEATAAQQRSAGDRAGETRALIDAGIIATNENQTEAIPRMLRRLISVRRLATDADTRALSIAALAMLLLSRRRHRLAQRLLKRIRREDLGVLPRGAIVGMLSLMGRYTDWDETLRMLEAVCADPASRAHAPSFFLFQASRSLLRGLRGQTPELCLVEAEEAAEALRDFRFTVSEMGAIDASAKLRAYLGRHVEAAAGFERAADLAEQLGHAEYEAGLRGQCAREFLATGCDEAAMEQAQRGAEVFERRNPGQNPITISFTAILCYRMLAECGDSREAYQRARRQEKRFRCPELPIGAHQTALLMARIAHLAGEEQEATALLEQARGLVERHGLRDLGPELDPELLAWAKAATPERNATWDVRTLGGLEVSRGGQPIAEAAWRGVTTRRLLMRMLAAPETERRERIEADLWPDAEPTRAGNNLRVALSRLRKALGADSVTTEGNRIGLATSLRSGWDVVRLEQALTEPGDPKLAVELLRGPFAPEFFDDWAENLRRDIEARVITLGCQRAEAWLGGGDPDAAALLASRLATLAPHTGEVWVLSAKAEMASGDHGAARRTIARARSLFERELGVDLGPELLALERELEQGAAPAAKSG